jgi:hypothetical protein
LFGRPSPRDDYLHTANAYPFSKFGDIVLRKKEIRAMISAMTNSSAIGRFRRERSKKDRWPLGATPAQTVGMQPQIERANFLISIGRNPLKSTNSEK